jgi:hypothetical protein
VPLLAMDTALMGKVMIGKTAARLITKRRLTTHLAFQRKMSNAKATASTINMTISGLSLRHALHRVWTSPATCACVMLSHSSYHGRPLGRGS